MSLSVDIILPCFRCKETVSETIESIKNQTFFEWRLIVVIDGYDEDLIELIKQTCFDIKSKSIITLQENSGVAYARNVGLKHSKADLIAFIDSDDLWEPRKLEVQISKFIENNQMALCATGHHRFKGNLFGGFTYEKKTSFVVISNNGLMFHNPFCFSSLVIKRQAIGELRFRNINHEDYDFLIRFVKDQSPLMTILTGKYVHYRVSDNSLSGNIFQSALKSLWVRRFHYGWFVTISSIPIYIYLAIRKRYFL